MIKYYIILSFIILSFSKGFAQSNSNDSLMISLTKDSLVQGSKEWFIQKYGDDQNSRDIIDFYFFRYKDYKRFPLNSLFIIVPSSVLILLMNNNRSSGLIDLRPLGYLFFGSAILIAVG